MTVVIVSGTINLDLASEKAIIKIKEHLNEVHNILDDYCMRSMAKDTCKLKLDEGYLWAVESILVTQQETRYDHI